jgi:predicted TPR repeat methyltransferase
MNVDSATVQAEGSAMETPAPRESENSAGELWRVARSSGNLAADRRYLYARAASAEGDHAAAAELLEQTADLAPLWAPLWLALGAAHEKTGNLAKAKTAFARLCALDPAGEFGAELHLARLGAAPAPAAAPVAYVRSLFDQYADRFDDHILGKLSYRGPALIARALDSLGARRFAHAIDLGCGTGLCGAAFRNRCDRLTGVDLSPRMVALAHKKQIYDRLETGSIEAFLASEPAQSASAVIAADVFVYLGDLAPVLTAASRVLAPGGHIAFTLQHGAFEKGYRVGADLRYAHSEAFVRASAGDAGLRTAAIEHAALRRDAGADVPGLIVAATRI